MPDANVPPPVSAISVPADKKFTRANNDRRIAAEITAASRFLRTVGTDPVIQPIALQYGIDAAELEAANQLVADAAKKWGVRLEGMGAEDNLVVETDAEFVDVREAFLAYRQVGRANFFAAADRTALGLSGDIPEGFNALMTHIRASYVTAKKPPYTELLTKRNYGPARLDALIKAVDDLIVDETDQTEAEGDAMTRTKERDVAYKAFKLALKPIRGTLQGALRGQPDLRAKLGG